MTSKKILFIGDSITDAWRNEDSEEIGYGYVRMIRDYFITTYPNSTYDFINKGISGNRISDLATRWEKDVIQLNPDYLSISIGINDVWRQLDHPEMEQIHPEMFEEYYQQLLTKVKTDTKAQIILMEPTVIEEEILSIGNRMLKNYVEIVHKVAKEFHAKIVPTHQAFLQYLQSNPAYKLTTDGVHMNSAGNTLMANSWIRAVEETIKPSGEKSSQSVEM
ncbi:SGNH/GDSL hydrolase family protein [Heyndrickxia oleronia]|uniref:SGNH/GDSL hydrolase family protein n=1 Tax=Heyndrickxia oleronia TaxID=38875 RepID=A0AAW6SZ01_9BACI|nr:SGNH/GDSL hydrolase family protein [Heyndrickxia oleronia]MDH5162237.1 SGNH/GDSL hydrolase family protein [Heyndrickxia oleronia]